MRKIIHIDADAFYAAIEIRDDPSLKGKPVAVGGTTDQRGVIATCSYEARTFGIHSAMPTRTALKLCPHLILIKPRMDVYRAASAEMRRIFSDYTSLIEPLSLDEAYLDVSESTLLKGSATLIAEEIRRRVFAKLSITVSAGVAPNKMLAKIASDWNKPNGIFVITPKMVDDFIRDLPVKKIHGVGRSLSQKLLNIGVERCEDLQTIDLFTLTQKFGSMGPRLYDLCRGIDNRPVVSERRRKSLSVENTFSEDVTSLDECISKLPELIGKLNVRLKKLDASYIVNKIFVKIKFSDFTTTTLERQGKFTNLESYIPLLSEAYDRQPGKVRLLGVGVTFEENIDQQGQLHLFSSED
ncbi:MAG: DNA polymerase IV [Cellvibrio sp.]